MVVIVGAGLAGLAAARELHRRGVPLLLLEATDRPGGRVRSLRTADGLTLDRGFQVLLDSYTTLRRLVPLASLQPRYFQSGALLCTESGTHRLLHPLRHPEGLLEAWRSPAISLSDKKRLFLLAAACAATPDAWLRRSLRQSGEITAREYLESFGFSSQCWQHFLRPFFGGVLLDAELGTSSGLLRYYLKKFVFGRAFLPAKGIGAFPAALAAPLPRDSFRTSAPVSRLRLQGQRAVAVQLEDGEDFACQAVIVATDEPATARLLPDRPPPRPGRPVWTFYYTSAEPFYSENLLLLNAKGGPIAHVAQVSNLSPELSSPERALLSVTVLENGGLGEKELERAVRQNLRELFPKAAEPEWAGAVSLDYAVPEQRPGFAGHLPLGSGLTNVFLAGDQVAGASIEGALRSGLWAARQAVGSREE